MQVHAVMTASETEKVVSNEKRERDGRCIYFYELQFQLINKLSLLDLALN